ncbi:hypothetical protein THTE_0801 [Thermogutta terrifontis]|uniref:Uncharacterized protein n=1 Tax=Thermogutta terrifontis TaxID=1331910 RepID=A0A286RBS2_9BACT|nr:hypothetical protein THTE_0801 [Thermogutta terrifontis]
MPAQRNGLSTLEKNGPDKRVPPIVRTSIVWIGGSNSTATGYRRSIRTDAKVVKAKAFTKKRR